MEFVLKNPLFCRFCSANIKLRVNKLLKLSFICDKSSSKILEKKIWNMFSERKTVMLILCSENPAVTSRSLNSGGPAGV